MERYVCVSHAAAIVAPLDTLIAGAQIAMPSKYAGISLREHHALAPTARTADEVLPIGCAAVVARHDRKRDRRGAFVRGVGVIDARLGSRPNSGVPP